MSRYMPQYANNSPQDLPPAGPSSSPFLPPNGGGDKYGGDKFSADSKHFIDKFGSGADTLSKFGVDNSASAKPRQQQRRQRSPARSDEEDPLDGDGDDGVNDPAGSLDAAQTSALTSQTLNTDGTPKRPMNAFMIFARRRRPQVSSENQAMRTGEISKILSREWNSMEGTEKQFYLDQAKQLKENFNAKYPDYVYRRRPNNSRKRRKPDGSLAGRTSAASSASANNARDIDEGAGSEPSPSDHGDDDHSHHPFGSGGGGPHRDYAPTAGGYGGGHPSGTGSNPRYQPYGSSNSNASGLSFDHDAPLPSPNNSRFAYSGSSADRRLSAPPPFSASSTGSSTSSRYPGSAFNPGMYNPSGPPPPSSGNPNDRQWSDRPRSSSNSHAWQQQNMQDRTLAKPYQSWTGSSSNHSPVDGHHGSGGQHHHNPNSEGFTFPTLTSPFFPAESPTGSGPGGAGGGYPAPPPSSSSSSHSHSTASPYPNSTAGIPLPGLGPSSNNSSSHRSSYDQRAYGNSGNSPSVSPNNPYPASSSSASSGGPPPSSGGGELYGRGPIGRILPPVNTIAGFGHSPQSAVGHSPVGGGPPQDFWNKEKEEH